MPFFLKSQRTLLPVLPIAILVFVSCMGNILAKQILPTPYPPLQNRSTESNQPSYDDNQSTYYQSTAQNGGRIQWSENGQRQTTENPAGNIYFGDSGMSQSDEARAMSPPHWGGVPQYWVPNSNAETPHSVRSEGQNTIRNDALPHSDRSQVPIASASTFANPKLPKSSAYQAVIDPDQLDLPDSQNYNPLNGLGQPREPTQGSIMPYYQPQTMHERGYGFGQPIHRGLPFDNGEKFPFEEKKKHYPPMKEIIATGRFFGMAELWMLRPSYNNNAVLRSQGPVFGESFQADHAFEAAPRIRLGFESKYGPGAELQYFEFDHGSNPISMVSNGITQGVSSVDVLGFDSPAILATANAGDRLTVAQALEVHSMLFCVFKEAKFPISRINGMLGFRYASIAEELRAITNDSSGAITGALLNTTDFRGFGPHFGIEYYRPMGHTKLELIGAASGSLLLGNRDQFVNLSDTIVTRRTGADEVVTMFDVMAGIQYSYNYAENRSYYVRLAALNQVWLGGGTPNSPTDDFAFRGVALSAGFNR